MRHKDVADVFQALFHLVGIKIAVNGKKKIMKQLLPALGYNQRSCKPVGFQGISRQRQRTHSLKLFKNIAAACKIIKKRSGRHRNRFGGANDGRQQQKSQNAKNPFHQPPSRKSFTVPS